MNAVDPTPDTSAPVSGFRRYPQVAYRLLRDQARVGIHRLPSPLSRRIIRARHLRHVETNMLAWTDPAFLSKSPGNSTLWRGEEPLTTVPHPGLQFEQLSITQAAEVRQWLNQGTFDSDTDLERRMDNAGDELGRVRAALRTRLRIAQGAVTRADQAQTGDRVLVDVRALQTKTFGGRGIGRFARAALGSVRASLPDSRVTLLIDSRLEDLPEHLTGRCEQVTRVTPDRAEEFALLVQTSPMTHDPTPLLHVLLGSAESLAIVYDFIPMHHPEVYLKFVGERAEYARNLEALRCYREFLCISQTVRNELVEHLGKQVGQRSTVAWPLSISQSMKKQITPKRAASTQGPVVVMTGDDARKNTFGGLAGIAAATSAHESRDVVVLGMNSGDDRVHHWSIAAAMRPGEALDSPHLTDNELTDLLAQAPCVVVPSFDEGLSLPVIEALVCGTPVVSSDIPAHRELLGDGKFMFDPTSPESIANAFEWVGKNPEVALRQRQTLLAHDHEDLEEQVSSVIGPFVDQIAEETEFLAESPIRVVDRELKVAVATPWPPQASGVADYSAATIRELAQLCDVTLFTTSGATVDHTGLDRMIKHARPVDEFLASPEEVADEFDCVIAVIGNSHFHTPFIELLTSTDCLVIAHDTRMTEYYLALRDRGGLGQLMLRTQDPQASTSLRPGLDDQVEDLRLLQNAGMWEIARQARSLIMHSVISQPLVKKQTGVSAHVLPFAHYRVAKPSLVDDAARRDARVRLGMHSDDSTLHLGTFGYVDIRTKQVDLVLEAAGWLTMWGHRIALHVVGSADDTTRGKLESRARALGLHQFEITGYQSEEMYQDWLRAIDLGIQLRISPFLGVSGPLADMAAFGVRAVASEGLCTDIGAPDFIGRLPDSISSTGLADAIEAAVTDSRSSDEREESRVGYIDSHSPKEYARALYDHILEVIV